MRFSSFQILLLALLSQTSFGRSIPIVAQEQALLPRDTQSRLFQQEDVNYDYIALTKRALVPHHHVKPVENAKIPAASQPKTPPSGQESVNNVAEAGPGPAATHDLEPTTKDESKPDTKDESATDQSCACPSSPGGIDKRDGLYPNCAHKIKVEVPLCSAGHEGCFMCVGAQVRHTDNRKCPAAGCPEDVLPMDILNANRKGMKPKQDSPASSAPGNDPGAGPPPQQQQSRSRTQQQAQPPPNTGSRQDYDTEERRPNGSRAPNESQQRQGSSRGARQSSGSNQKSTNSRPGDRSGPNPDTNRKPAPKPPRQPQSSSQGGGGPSSSQSRPSTSSGGAHYEHVGPDYTYGKHGSYEYYKVPTDSQGKPKWRASSQSTSSAWPPDVDDRPDARYHEQARSGYSQDQSASSNSRDFDFEKVFPFEYHKVPTDTQGNPSYSARGRSSSSARPPNMNDVHREFRPDWAPDPSTRSSGQHSEPRYEEIRPNYSGAQGQSGSHRSSFSGGPRPSTSSGDPNIIRTSGGTRRIVTGGKKKKDKGDNRPPPAYERYAGRMPGGGADPQSRSSGSGGPSRRASTSGPRPSFDTAREDDMPTSRPSMRGRSSRNDEGDLYISRNASGNRQFVSRRRASSTSGKKSEKLGFFGRMFQ